MRPTVEWARASARAFSTEGSWLASLPGAGNVAAGYELLHRLGKSYDKPTFGIDAVASRGARVAVMERTVVERPFCRLQRFKRFSDDRKVLEAMKADPSVLLVAPLSGHHATLLRDTARTLLSEHKVYVTDWTDARTVPLDRGPFTLADYVEYLRTFIQQIPSDNLHVVAVCQATVPTLAAVSLMAASQQRTPRSLVLMGGPVDARRSPTTVNDLAMTKPLSWFENFMIHRVPAGHPGRGRNVYPGFLQYAGFVAMNPLRHMNSHWNFYQQLVRGDLEDAEVHRKFYDEYNAVLDMAAEYYLDTIKVVFQEHLLPLGRWEVSGQLVEPSAIAETALLTVEGELDDLSGCGQTQAALGLCSGMADGSKRHLVVNGAGHYGIFSGRRWREQVYPELRDLFAASAPRQRRRS